MTLIKCDECQRREGHGWAVIAVVGAGVVGFGAAAGAVTVRVTAGAATGAFAEPHAARLIPAANAMAAGIAITLLSFIVLPSPRRFS